MKVFERNTDAAALSKLRPVFQKDGQVTAGNASTLNDGASAVVLANAEYAKQQGWEILAYIDDYCTSGVAAGTSDECSYSRS